MTDASKRPTCFGLPSVYHQESEHCRACALHQACEERAYATLTALAASVDVRDALARYQGREGRGARKPLYRVKVDLTVAPERTARRERVRHALSQADERLLEGMPVKVAQKVRLIMQQGIDRLARSDLARGRNPFPAEGAKYMHAACELLLAGGFTRTELRNEYVRRLQWSQGTAASHVSAVVAIFPALGFAKERYDGRFILEPTLRSENI